MTALGKLQRTSLLVGIEAFAVAQFAVLQVLFAHSARYVTENRAPRSVPAFVFLLPFALGVLASVATFVGSTRSPALAERIERSAARLRPALVLWMLPPLLVRGVFARDELFLMLALSALVVGTEWSLGGSTGRLPGHAALRASRALGRLRPSWVALGLVSAAFLLACHGSVRIHRKMLTSTLDFGLFENLFFNTLQGRHGIALDGRYFGEHAEFFLYALLPVYALFPYSETLLVLQSFFVVGAAIPLFFLARRWLRDDWQAVLLVCVYLLFPSIHGALFYDFHFLPFSAFFVLSAAYFHSKRQLSGFWIAALFAMSCREDVALGLSAVGFALALLRPAQKPWLALGFAGAAWFVAVKFVWMPRFAGQSFVDHYQELIAPGSHGFGGVVRTIVANPLYTLSRTLTASKLVLALHLLAPLAFLPIRQRRTLCLLLPGALVVGLSTGSSAITQFQFHYATHFVPYLFVAAIIALAVRARERRGAAITAMLVGSLVSAVQFDAFFGPTFRTSFHEVSFDWTRADAKRSAHLAKLAALVPGDASVSAGEHEGPQFARRAHLRSVKEGIADFEYVIYSTRSLRWGGDANVEAVLKERTHGVVGVEGDLTLLKRGADTRRNGEALKALKRLRRDDTSEPG